MVMADDETSDEGQAASASTAFDPLVEFLAAAREFASGGLDAAP